MISAVKEMLEDGFLTRNITAITKGLEGQSDSLANIAFGDSRRKLLFESYKYTLAPFMGLDLSPEEAIELDNVKESMYRTEAEKDEYQLECNQGTGYTIKSSIYQENNLSVANRIKSIRTVLDEEDEQSKEKIAPKIENERKKGNEPNLAELYKPLHTRPMALLDKMVDGNYFVELKIVRKDIKKQPANKQEGKGLRKMFQFLNPLQRKVNNNSQEKEEAA